MEKDNKFQEIIKEIFDNKIKNIEKDFEKMFGEIMNISKTFKGNLKSELDEKDLLKLKEIIGQETTSGGKEVDLSDFKDLIKQIGEADTQSKILNLLMDGLKEYTTRAYFFVKKGEKIVCFKSSGTKSNRNKNILMPESLDTSLRYVFDTGEIYLGDPKIRA